MPLRSAWTAGRYQTVDDRHYYFKEFALENSRMAVCSADLSPASWEPAWIPLL